MESKNLKVGYMKFEELAAWVGISYSTFRKKARKTAILNSLHFYCNYEIVKGGVNIMEVYIEDYDKHFEEDVRFLLTKIFQQPLSSKHAPLAYIGTVKELAEKSIDEYNQLRAQTGREPITNVEYLGRRFSHVCNILFSKERYSSKENRFRAAFDEVAGGPYGWKQGQLLIKDSYNSNVRELTSEDWELFFNISSRMEEMKDVVDSQAFVSSLVDYCDGVQRAPEEIGQYVKEYMESLKKVKNSFGEILKRYKQLTGKILVRGTVWIFRTARGKEVKLLVDVDSGDSSNISAESIEIRKVSNFEW